jgi:hypothetical protein
MSYIYIVAAGLWLRRRAAQHGPGGVVSATAARIET